jgi:hypothetical protein
MRRVNLFPLRLARFLIAYFAWVVRPTGPRDRLLRKCRREHEVDPSRQKQSHLYMDEKASIRRNARRT